MSGVIEVPEPNLVVPPDGVYEHLPDNAVTDDAHLGEVVEKISKGLNPFDYHSSQVSLARKTAYSVIDDRTFALRESLTIARELRARRFLRLFRRRYSRDQVREAAEARFDQTVAPTIACTMAAISSGNAMYTLAFFKPDLSAEESLRLAEEQIDKVDLCQLQVFNTLKTSRVREAYVDNVAARAERILIR